MMFQLESVAWILSARMNKTKKETCSWGRFVQERKAMTYVHTRTDIGSDQKRAHLCQDIIYGLKAYTEYYKDISKDHWDLRLAK